MADGSFPNVFNNETPDASFGVTSPIFIDRMTITGGVISIIPITTLLFNQTGANVATSFPSKSELGLSLTPNASGVTFMAYGSAANALDVSNANTPGHVDITNLVNGRSILINQRDIIELSATGAALVTTTNTYSGNNGRNVVLGSNGNYFMAGNAGNNGKSVSLATGTVTLTSGSSSVSLSGASSTANLFVGTPFSGTNVPTGTYITSIADATHFTISAPATGTASGKYTANAGAVQLVGTQLRQRRHQHHRCRHFEARARNAAQWRRIRAKLIHQVDHRRDSLCCQCRNDGKLRCRQLHGGRFQLDAQRRHRRTDDPEICE